MRMSNIPIFEPIYPEWKVSREMRKMEKRTGKKRVRAQVLAEMENQNEKPLRICMDCTKTCIQKQVVGLTKFECFEKK